MMQFLILGPLSVIDGRRSVELSATQERTLLQRLLLDPNATVAFDTLIDDLWAGDPPVSAVRALRVYVSRLRRALGDRDRIQTQAGGYCLRVAPGECDVDQFEELAARGQLNSALELWRGRALADVAGCAWAAPEAERLEERRLSVIESRIREDIATGRLELVLPELEALSVRHPERQSLWSSLILARYLSGRPAEALAAYDLFAARLELAEQGPPDAELQTLANQILTELSEPAASDPTASDPTASAPTPA